MLGLGLVRVTWWNFFSKFRSGKAPLTSKDYLWIHNLTVICIVWKIWKTFKNKSHELCFLNVFDASVSRRLSIFWPTIHWWTQAEKSEKYTKKRAKYGSVSNSETLRVLVLPYKKRRESPFMQKSWIFFPYVFVYCLLVSMPLNLAGRVLSKLRVKKRAPSCAMNAQEHTVRRHHR